MNILALDQSSTLTGYSIFNTETKELINSGLINLSGKTIEQRLFLLRNKILELITENNIEKIFLEDIQLQSNVSNNVTTYKVLAYVIGNLIELSEEQHIPYELVPSTVWKSSLGIKGRKREEQKANAKTYVLNTYNLNVSTDVADAICIGTHVVKGY